MKGQLLTMVLISLLCVNAKAQQRQLFDGGMMLHGGYVSCNVNALHYSTAGMSSGIGGVLRFHVGDHLRLGGEGYVSTLRTMDNGSHIRMGWGGAVADAYWHIKRWMPYAGLCIGGGTTSTLLVFRGSDSDWVAEDGAVLHNGRFFFFNPYIGVEYALTEAVHLTLKADRLMPLTGEAVPEGVRFYLGFIFAH